MSSSISFEEPAFLAWLTHACLPHVQNDVQALRKTYPQMGTLLSKRDAVGHQQL